MSKKLQSKLFLGAAILLGTSVTLLSCGGPATSEGENSSSSSSNDTSSTLPIESHSISIGETGGAVLELSAETASSGTRIEITVVSVPDDKIISAITTDVPGVDVISSGNNSYYFIMPNSDVTISVTLSDQIADSYPLTLINNTDGEIVGISDSQSNQIDEENGIYNLTPNASYYLRIINYTGAITANLNGAPLTIGEYYISFVMPAAASTLTIDPAASYSVSFIYDAEAFSEDPILIDFASDYGTILTPSNIVEGTEVYIAAYPNSGYLLTAINLDGTPIQEENGNYVFTMPGHNVTLEFITESEASSSYLLNVNDVNQALNFVVYEVNDGVFEEIENYTPTQRFLEGSTLAISFSVTAPYRNIYTLGEIVIDGVSVTPDSEGHYSFVVADHNVEITANTTLIQHNLAFDAQGSGASCLFYNEEDEIITTAGWNQMVKAVFTHPEGLTLLAVYQNGTLGTGALEGNTYTFTMGQTDLTLTAGWSNSTNVYNLGYSVTPSDLAAQVSVTFFDSDNGFGDEITEAVAGQTVYAQISVESGYRVANVSFNGNTLSLVEGYYPLTVLEEDVNLEITVEVSNTYNLVIDRSNAPSGTIIDVVDENGTYLELVSGHYELSAGDIVYFDPWAPDSTVSAMYANGTALEFVSGIPTPSGTGYQLEMPSENVTITIEWGEGEIPSGSNEIIYVPSDLDPQTENFGLNIYSGSTWQSVTSAQEGEMILINVYGYPENYTIENLYVNGVVVEFSYDYGMYVFTMPATTAYISISWLIS